MDKRPMHGSAAASEAPGQTPSTRWVVVTTYAQAEWQVYTTLLHKGIQAFLPYTLGSSRRGRWSHGVVRPMYPGYIFAALEGEASTDKIRQVSGVNEFLRNNGQLALVPSAYVERVRRHWLEEYRKTRPHLIRVVPPKVGDIVAVPFGAFQGVPCQIESLDKSGNVCASIGQLQVNFRLEDVAKRVRGSAEPAINPKSKKELRP